LPPSPYTRLHTYFATNLLCTHTFACLPTAPFPPYHRTHTTPTGTLSSRICLPQTRTPLGSVRASPVATLAAHLPAARLTSAHACTFRLATHRPRALLPAAARCARYRFFATAAGAAASPCHTTRAALAACAAAPAIVAPTLDARAQQRAAPATYNGGTCAPWHDRLRICAQPHRRRGAPHAFTAYDTPRPLDAVAPLFAPAACCISPRLRARRRARHDARCGSGGAARLPRLVTAYRHPFHLARFYQHARCDRFSGTLQAAWRLYFQDNDTMDKRTCRRLPYDHTAGAHTATSLIATHAHAFYLLPGIAR